jgi:hypothetical protein
MNLSEHSLDKELFFGTNVEENTMNLSEHSVNKELFSGEQFSKENTHYCTMGHKHEIIPNYNIIYNKNFLYYSYIDFIRIKPYIVK